MELYQELENLYFKQKVPVLECGRKLNRPYSLVRTWLYRMTELPSIQDKYGETFEFKMMAKKTTEVKKNLERITPIVKKMEAVKNLEMTYGDTSLDDHWIIINSKMHTIKDAIDNPDILKKYD